MPVITNADVTGARVVPFGSRFNIEVSFTSDGARRMAAATAAHIGEPLAVMIDGRVISAPIVDGTIDQGALLTGYWPRTEADELVAGLTGR